MALGCKTGGRKRGTPNKVGSDLRKAAREHSDVALRIILRLMKAKATPAAVKLRAAEVVLDRGWGRASQRNEWTGPDDGPIVPVINLITHPESDAAREAKEKFLASEHGGSRGCSIS
jgi:hypothetical protein